MLSSRTARAFSGSPLSRRTPLESRRFTVRYTAPPTRLVDVLDEAVALYWATLNEDGNDINQLRQREVVHLVEEVSLSMKPPISDRLDQAIVSSAMHGDSLVLLAREFVETQANPPKTKEELQVRLDQLKTLIAPIKKREAGNLIVQEPDVIVSNMPSTDAVDVAASGAKPSLENKFVVEAVNGRQDRSIDTISDEKAIVEAEVLTAIVTAVAVGVAFVAKFPMVIAGSPLLSSKFAAFMTWFQVRLNEFP
jgi:hypothetical protein